MESSFLRWLGAIAGSAALIIACSGSSTSVGSSSSGTTSTSGATGTSGTGGSSGSCCGNESSTTSSSGGPVISTSGVQSIVAGKDVCGKPAGSCQDAQAYSVSFTTGELTHITCVELATHADGGKGTQDATATKTLTSDQLATVTSKLGAIRISSAPVTGEDGPIVTLQVQNATGTKVYSPDAGCGDQASFTMIVSGFDDLFATLASF